jgi:hypothetical protein
VTLERVAHGTPPEAALVTDLRNQFLTLGERGCVENACGIAPLVVSAGHALLDFSRAGEDQPRSAFERRIEESLEGTEGAEEAIALASGMGLSEGNNRRKRDRWCGSRKGIAS